MMNHLLEQHFDKILSGHIDEAILDYSESLVCIARTGKQPQTLSYTGAKKLMLKLQKVLDFSDLQVSVKQSTEDYGVLTVKSKFAPFLSYTCIVKNGRIAYMTLYIYQPAKNILPSNLPPMPKCKAASKMFGKHLRAMFSMKASVITKDYGKNAVVITNMSKDTCNGIDEIYKFCDDLMKNSRALIKKMSFKGITSVRWKSRSAGEGLFLFTIEAPKMGMVMTETYWVENGKIQFENSIADGKMIDLLQELMD